MRPSRDPTQAIDSCLLSHNTIELPLAGWPFILWEIANGRPLSDERMWPAGEWIAGPFIEMNIHNLTSCAPFHACPEKLSNTLSFLVILVKLVHDNRRLFIYVRDNKLQKGFCCRNKNGARA